MKEHKPKKTVKKTSKHIPKPEPLETAAKETDAATCTACELSTPLACPFCTKEGLILIALAIILIAIDNAGTRYAAWIVLLCAFLVPVLKNVFKKRS